MTQVTSVNPAVSPSDRDVEAFIERIKKLYHYDQPAEFALEKRRSQRYRITIPINVTPLGDDFDQAGYTCRGVSRDISATGVGLVIDSPVDNNWLLLTFLPCDGRTFTAMAKRVYIRGEGLYFRVGCEFIF